jgi:hypothetical protein
VARASQTSRKTRAVLLAEIGMGRSAARAFCLEGRE